jgi:hypothetical protein
MFALISTIDAEQPYRFCETSEIKFPVTEPALFWVDCPENVAPHTHKWDGIKFTEIPPAPPIDLSAKKDVTLSVV